MSGNKISNNLPNGVMLNAYPDSIGTRLKDTIDLLKRPEMKDAFSLFYILPTFFNSDLDRGFSVIDYDINQELVSDQDIKEMKAMGISLKVDLVLNHLSVQSPQFRDMLNKGKDSPFKDFFIDWNEFWKDHGEMREDGVMIPHEEYLNKLFMRKPGLPILRVCFPDGSRRNYWNTFYQQVDFENLQKEDLESISGLSDEQKGQVVSKVNKSLKENEDIEKLDLGELNQYKDKVLAITYGKAKYLGQMDLNAKSEVVWDFYDETLRKLKEYGTKIIRLDAFAYLHKEPGQSNFFNRPGTWEYLERLRGIANKYDVIIFPEVHAQYGAGLHEEVANNGYPIYDFFLPGVLLDALDRSNSDVLKRWINEIVSKGLNTINMLGCHDGIPVLDLKGITDETGEHPGLLEDKLIEDEMDRILERGGIVKNLYGPNGEKIHYYQINATYFSALGEDDRKLLLARAIQMFTPGIPQVWYLDLFAGKNDHAAVKAGETASHKEINRTTLTLDVIEEKLKQPVVTEQIKLLRLRNTSKAFLGDVSVSETESHILNISWKNGSDVCTLKANLKTFDFTITENGNTLNISI